MASSAQLAASPQAVGLAQAPTVGELAMGALSSSSGSVLIDGAVGTAVGYAVAPKAKRLSYALVTGAATGLGGVFGLGLSLVGMFLLSQKAKK